MTSEDRKYFTNLITGVRVELSKLRKDLAKVESIQNRIREQKKENSRLVSILEKHGITDAKPRKRRQPKSMGEAMAMGWA
jgi:hypothetical protein